MSKTEIKTDPASLNIARASVNDADLRDGRQLVGLVVRDGLTGGAAVRIPNGRMVEIAAGSVRSLPRLGRPPMRDGETRVAIHPTVRPATAAAIDADRRDGESAGQVLDRWAAERQK